MRKKYGPDVYIYLMNLFQLCITCDSYITSPLTNVSVHSIAPDISWEEISHFNTFLQSLAANDPKVAVVDVATPIKILQDTDQVEFNALFIDNVHFGNSGFEIMKVAFENAITAHEG